ncbi:hypothetical protein AB0L82_43255 [Nocardia sp. NPDC052001]|uniref:hypothetical protein n=1 Tax=Nocardia sp. NPDC052001 TaxID=3154853 RepID=UPI00343EE5A4
MSLVVSAPAGPPAGPVALIERLSTEALAEVWAGCPEELSWIAADAMRSPRQQVIAGVRAELALFFQDELDIARWHRNNPTTSQE